LKNKSTFLKCAAIGIFTGLCNGLFGSGGGTVVVPAMEKILGVEEHRAHATAIAIILPLTILSAVLYTMRGFLDFSLVWQVSLGGVAGGAAGAILLKNVPTGILRKIFGAAMMVAAVRMVF